MKIDNNTLQAMQNDIQIIVNHFNVDLSNIDDAFKNRVWGIVCTQRINADFNRFGHENKTTVKVNGERLLPYTPEFESLPCGANDTNLMTALNKIFSNISNGK